MLTKNNNLYVIISAALFSLLVFVLAPLNIYFNNLDEMSITATDLVRLCLVPALLTALTLSLIGYLLPKKLQILFQLMLAGITVMVWLQSNLMVWDYGLLDGRTIKWKQYTWQGWVDGGIWLTVLAGIILAGRKHGKAVFTLATLVFVIQSLSVITVGLQKHKEWVEKRHGMDAELETIVRFSNKQNIVHLMLDGFQADVFNDLINMPGLGEQYRSIFKGFTYFPETLSVFPYTRFSVPSFLSGKIYSNTTPQDTYVDRVLSDRTILSLAKNKGFVVDIVAGEPYLENRYQHIPHDHFFGIHNHVTSKPAKVARVIDIALFRAVPHFAKPAIYNNQSWLLAKWLASDKKMRFNYFKDTAFLNQLVKSMTADRNRPVYKYIHVMNTHNPMVVKSHCQYAGKVSPMTRQNLTFQAKCTLDTVAAMMQKMKKLGIYDSSLIIVHADHGGWVGNHWQKTKISFPGNKIAPDWVASLASPLMAIKLPKEQKKLEISSTLVSLADLPDTIADIMNWEESFDHLSIYSEDATNPQRERFFRFYSWRKNEWDQQYAPPIVEFSIKGSHYDTEWESINMYYPPRN